MGTHFSLLVDLLGGSDLRNQELVMKEVEEYVHSGAHCPNLGLVRDSVHWDKYFVSFYKSISFFHLQLRLGFVN